MSQPTFDNARRQLGWLSGNLQRVRPQTAQQPPPWSRPGPKDAGSQLALRQPAASARNGSDLAAPHQVTLLELRKVKKIAGEFGGLNRLADMAQFLLELADD
jgi:hypothetical protein